jgi:SAM-dependent methyltransferase
MMTDTPLNAAYALHGPDDCLRLYRDWAATYDADFAQGMDYLMPAHVARAFLAAGGQGPVLDVGAGTGLVARALRDMGFGGAIDGVDISAEMLARATEKGLYRHLSRADVTLPLTLGLYSGIVSSGTFTHGHVGPEALPHLLAAAAPGAQFAVSIKQDIYTANGFDSAFAALSAQITATQLIDAQIYGPAAADRDPDHAADRAWIALFRKR